MKRLLATVESSFQELPVKFDVPWREVTTFGLGDAIPILVEPTDDISLLRVLKRCRREGVPVFILGAGSNLVGSAEPLDGVVVRLRQNDFIRVKASRTHVTAGAGVKLHDFCLTCAHKGFGGVAPLAAIPGTVGGALRMNAGADGFNLGPRVTEVCGLTRDGEFWSAEGNQVEWGYRASSLPEDVVVTAAIFQLDEIDADEELAKIKREISRRRREEPKARSAGCVFKNPDLETPAGKLIDQAGCKSMAVGEVAVSDAHANYFVNRGGGSVVDFLALARNVKTAVHQRAGVLLKPEIRFFNEKDAKAFDREPKPEKIAVLMGGNSAEREVSLESGAAVAEALRIAGWKVRRVDVKRPTLAKASKEADVVFPVLHGGFGENGEIQNHLDAAGLPYVGCDGETCALVMDKIRSKEVMIENGVSTADYAVVEKDGPHDFPSNLRLPVVVKPSREGSTYGVSIVKSEKKWKKALKLAFRYDDRLLVETYVKGVETTVGIVDGTPCPIVEIRYPGVMFDYDAKYTHARGETRYFCPSRSIDESSRRTIQNLALRFYEAVNARDLLRVDMIVGENGFIHVLEGNTMPGFTASSLLPKAAAVAGISFTALCAKLARLATRRQRNVSDC